MDTHHNKLVLSQNISLALRLTESLSDTKEQGAAKKDTINELIKNINLRINDELHEKK